MRVRHDVIGITVPDLALLVLPRRRAG